MLLLGGPAACSGPDGTLFGDAGGVGGSGAAGSAARASSSGAMSSSQSASASSAASSASSSATSGASSSSGGPVCGNMICEPPAETPVFCPQDCPGGSSSSSGGGMCNHPACDTGDALDPACDPCAGMVCASDPFCCDSANGNWDGQCVNEADQQCGACCGNAMCNSNEDCNSCAQDCPGPCQPPPTCQHSACFVDVALDPVLCRDPCVDKVCAQDPSCCMGPWQDKCGILAANCGPDPCVTAVCAAMPSCCTSMWSQACVDQAKISCNTQCNCQHSICQGGGALATDCNPCVTELCKADSYCCSTSWDNICVGEVESICGIICN